MKKFIILILLIIAGYFLYNFSFENYFETKESSSDETLLYLENEEQKPNATKLVVRNDLPEDYEFAGVLYVIHEEDFSLDYEGKKSDKELEYLAEIGKNGPFVKKLEANKKVLFVDTTTSHVKNGEMAKIDLPTFLYSEKPLKISILSMVAESNDGYAFIELPLNDLGMKDVFIYDAGTENNSPLDSGFEGGQPSIRGGLHLDHGVATIPLDYVKRHPQLTEAYMSVILK